MDDTQSYPLYNDERENERTYIPIDLFEPKTDRLPTDTEHKLRELIADNIGRYVRCEFLIGTQCTTIREGVLKEIGTSFIVLYHEDDDSYESCDFYALKFMTFFRCREHARKAMLADRQRRR